MERSLRIKLTVSQEIDESSLLNKFVLSIDSIVFKLLLGVSQVLVLLHFSAVSPHVGHLSVLVV